MTDEMREVFEYWWKNQEVHPEPYVMELAFKEIAENAWVAAIKGWE
jgi:hypothetical protein